MADSVQSDKVTYIYSQINLWCSKLDGIICPAFRWGILCRTAGVIIGLVLGMTGAFAQDGVELSRAAGRSEQDGGVVSWNGVAFQAGEMSQTIEEVGTLTLSPVWEENLASKYSKDADANHHGFVVLDDAVYLFVEQYLSSSKPNNYILRKVDVATGEVVSEIDVNWLFDGFRAMFYRNVVTKDDAGHLLGVSVHGQLGPDDTRLVFGINIRVVDDLEGQQAHQVVAYTESDSSTDTTQKAPNRWAKNQEILRVTGDVVAGNFAIEIGGWRATQLSGQEGTACYPSICSYTFTSGNPLPIQTWRVLISSEEALSIKDAPNTEQERYSCMLWAVTLPDQRIIAQPLGSTTAAVFQLSPNSDVTTQFAPTPTEYIAVGNLPETNARQYTYGTTHLQLGDIDMLLQLSDFGATGSKFQLIRVPEIATSSSATTLFQLPTSASTFGHPTASSFYGHRPFCHVAYTTPAQPAESPAIPSPRRSRADTPAENARIYTYMPGSGLGAYDLTLNRPVSATSTPRGDTVAPLTYTLTDGTLRLFNLPADAHTLDIYTPSGRLIQSRPLQSIAQVPHVGAPSATIDLRGLPSGMYIGRLRTTSTAPATPIKFAR